MDGTFSFAKRLADAKQRAGIDQKELIRRLDGPAQSTVSKWENGGSEPGAENIRKLAVALGCTADYLVGLTDSPLPLPPGHWVIDSDGEEMLRKKQVPPDGGRWAWPVPPRYEVVSSLDYQRRRDKLYGKLGKGGRAHE